MQHIMLLQTLKTFVYAFVKTDLYLQHEFCCHFFPRTLFVPVDTLSRLLSQLPCVSLKFLNNMLSNKEPPKHIYLRT